jgi:AraC family transcriptional regulator, regulatory protein of adaptative response / methylated-DNA-[protein]-cysteine methyltransferase
MNTSSAAVETESETQASLDYHRIEKAIAYLQAHYLEQPELATVAQATHLSEFHFQRLFTRWAGISPKRFLQFLTIEHAKQQLANSKAVLETTFDSGLSSSGRLHDLFVSVEAVTPGEFKTRGVGIRINYGLHATRFGDCLLGVTERGVCWLGFVRAGSKDEAIREMKQHWAGATFARRPDLTAAIATRIFSGLNNGRQSPLSLLLLGTNFQIKVWQALLKIPAGELVSYETIGDLISARDSSRSIGSAVGSNPIAYLIPCHRVIRKTGLLGGYRWGLTRKRAMLGWESAQIKE